MAGALRERGLPAPSRWFASGGFLLPQSKAVAVEMLASSDRPSAVFAGSDETAFGIMLAARRIGLRVPEDLSIVGVDDHSWSAAFDLTTVRQEPHEQGAAAGRIALAELTGSPHSTDATAAPHELIVRGSTAAPAPSGQLRAGRAGSV